MRNRPTEYAAIYRMVNTHGVWLHDDEDYPDSSEVWVFDGQAVFMHHPSKTARFLDEFYRYQQNRREMLKKKAEG